MRYSLTVAVEPAAEPVTLAEAKLHLRVDTGDTSQDAVINALITGARQWAEEHTRRSFVRRTYTLKLDNWLPCIKLPRGKVSSVSSITYIDTGGTSQTLGTDQYQVDSDSEPARIVPAYGVVYPTIKSGQINGITITYLAGYAPDDSASPTDHAGNVPDAIKSALKLWVEAHYDRDPGSMDRLLMAVKALLIPYEIRDYALE